jgi:sortase A
MSATNPMPESTPDSARARTLRGALRIAEATLALGGVACLVAYAIACAQASYTQSSQSALLDEALRAQLSREAPNREEWSAVRVAKYEETLAKPVEALGRLEIPDAGVSVMLLEGTDDHTLDRAVGRIEGTARIGDHGNVGIAGHRDGYFRGLRHLERGDALSLATLDGTAHYEVSAIQIVEPSQVDVLAASDEPMLTLVTCYPFYYVGDAPKRYIVHARQVRFDPWQAATTAAAQAR